MAFDQYKNSPYSVGLLLHILFDKYGIMESDYWTYSRDVIKHGDSNIGTFYWNDNGTWATFNFIDEKLNNRVLNGAQKLLSEIVK